MSELAEDIFEFNAPQHYCDLSAKLHEEPDDSYFDCHDGEGPYKLVTPSVEGKTSRPLRSSSRHNTGTPRRSGRVAGTPKMPQRETPMKPPTPVRKPPTPVRKPPTPVRKPPTPVREPPTPVREPPTPVREPLAPLREPPTPVQKPSTPEREPPTPTEMEADDAEEMENKENTPRYADRKGINQKKKSISPRVGIRSSPRLAAIAKAMRRSNASRRSISAGSRSSSDADGSNLSLVNKNKTQNKPSVPKVPGVQGLSEEDYKELEAITTFKQKLVRNKKKAESINKNARINPTVPQEFHFATDTRLRNKHEEEPTQSLPAAPVRKSRLGPTRPLEFKFATDGRIKKQTNTEDEEAVTFPHSLRSGSSAGDKELRKGPTIPQPFNLTESRKSTESEANKYVSVAELNLKFHTRTPQRFRSKRSDVSDEGTTRNYKKSKTNSGVTIPVTPAFATRTRSREVNYLTREEMEQKAFEEEQKHKFKANPVNKKIFEAPAGLHVDRKHSTVPEPFNITKTKKEEAAPRGNNFKEMCNKLGCSTSSIASLPWGGVPSKWEKTNTKIQPFSFDSRDKQKLLRKQEKIEKIIEDEKHLADFKAHPMPIFEDGVHGVPEKKPPTPTRAKPFNLRSDQRGELKKEQIQRSLEEEERLDKERRVFHATSDAVVHKQPFIPEKSKRPLTDISGFTLNTEIRAEARTDFELHQKQKEDELAAAKREQEERQKAEEAAEVARLRREAVHKANPVRNYKALEIKPAPCPPTVPISPNFATKSRLRSRNNVAVSANSTMNISSATFTSE